MAQGLKEDKPDMMYIALLKASAVRDVQFCTNAELDPMDDAAWEDLPEAEIYLGLFTGKDQKAVLLKAAEYANTVPENVRLVPFTAN